MPCKGGLIRRDKHSNMAAHWHGMHQSRGWSRDSRPKKERNEMVRVWSKPVIVEIAVGMEINCYACAELD